MNKRGLTSAISSLKKEAAALIREARKQELPANKKRREGDGSPLTAWMAGAGKREPSKIVAVTEGRARYPYSTLSASIEVLADRISSKYNITAAQYEFLLFHLSGKYRGRVGYGERYYGKQIIDRDLPRPCLKEAVDFLRDASDGMNIPLSAILSKRLADLILLHQLYTSTEKAVSNGR